MTRYRSSKRFLLIPYLLIPCDNCNHNNIIIIFSLKPVMASVDIVGAWHFDFGTCLITVFISFQIFFLSSNTRSGKPVIWSSKEGKGRESEGEVGFEGGRESCC